MGYPEAEISLLFLNDKAITELNRTYRGKERPTNVLAFSMREGPFPELNPQVLGDVVISLDTAKREAGEAGIPLEEHLKNLLIHGILHLLGYDHEKGGRQARKMEKQAEIIRRELCGNYRSM